VLIVEYIKVE